MLSFMLVLILCVFTGAMFVDVPGFLLFGWSCLFTTILVMVQWAEVSRTTRQDVLNLGWTQEEIDRAMFVLGMNYAEMESCSAPIRRVYS